MKVYNINLPTLQSFESEFKGDSHFVPSLLRFEYQVVGCILKGVYEENQLIASFILTPYRELHRSRSLTILRLERPLASMRLSKRKRSEVLNAIRDYSVDWAAKGGLCDYFEMELFNFIKDEVFFPSSLSTVGSFNFVDDYSILVSRSFDKVRETTCFQFLLNSPDIRKTNDGGEGWKVANLNSKAVWKEILQLTGGNAMIYPNRPIFDLRFLPYIFNLPEYCLRKDVQERWRRIFVKKRTAYLQWFPDFYPLIRDSWKGMTGDRKQVHELAMSIPRGKIYRILTSDSMEKLLSNIKDAFINSPFSHISKMQVLCDQRYKKMLSKANGKAVQTLALFRKRLK